tara:strand:- start:109 stop:1188 length:1080 start_codon:yes stop_codon:yes gene_type:complete
MSKTVKTSLITLAALLFWMFTGIFSSEDKRTNSEVNIKGDKIENNSALVSAKVFTSKPKISFVVLRGRTEADRNVFIAAETTGIIENIFFEKGEKVKKGDIICKQTVDARKAKVDEANALMRQRELEWQASKKLVEKGYRSQTQLAASSAAYDASKALVKQMEQELDNINIRAPFDGVFNEKLAEVGDFLSIGKPCGKVVDYNPIKITAQVSEKEISNVKIGINSSANLSTGETVQGPLTYISNTADPATRTFRIEMEVENDIFSYKDGLTAEIFIPIREINGHLIPPSSLTLNEKGEVGVRHIVNKNIAQFSKVEILGDEGEYVWIAGLPEKVIIITIGHEFVSSGDLVNYKLQDDKS